MDGILSLRVSNNPSTARITIPYLPLNLGNNAPTSFADYPRFLELQDRDGNPAIPDDRAPELPACLQTWLFFGLLSEFLQERINPFDFAVDGIIDLNQDKSHNYFENWAARVEGLSKGQREAEFKRIITALELASVCVDVYDDPSYESAALDRIALSIKLLASLLLRIAEETFTHPGDDDRTRREIRRLKGEAIKQITQIYAGASEVLVLDRDLETLETPTTLIQPWECAVRILSSTWAQRGWTLEEGSIAQSCVFRIADRPYDMDMLTDDTCFKQLPASVTSPLWKAWWNFQMVLPAILGRELGEEKRRLTVEPSFRRRHLESYQRIPQFVRIWNSLVTRSTTREEDGVIILTNLLDFHVSRLLQTPEDDRLPLRTNADVSIIHSKIRGFLFELTPQDWLLAPFGKLQKVLAEEITRLTFKIVSQISFWMYYVKSKQHSHSLGRRERESRMNEHTQKSLVIVDLEAGNKGRGSIGMGARCICGLMNQTLFQAWIG
ncbi:hypothetical protein CDV31_016912 [Fusarium ambrosium]|uniref:Heterokaryon incompatibility domain-containing protein n=1 Tax=Fusarium ambrosium TaxID=131363 RepID=A0A428RZ04_9HYPO|nr:hypothetical protein CDV31_016912 [Fusarium ambrosium]